ncbi:MAG: hypothetical protein R3B09_17910 [Nannocystaceae bacterium]
MAATTFLIQMTNASKSYRNGFKDSATVGALKIQWGQDVCTSDGLQTFNFPSSFHSACYAVVITSSLPNARSGLPVVLREKGRFGVDRDGGIDGPYPFYWIAIGDASATPESGSFLLPADEDVAPWLLWGDLVSNLDGDQSFTTSRALPAGASAIVLNTTLANLRSALPATSFDGAGRSLRVNRNNDINGSVGFSYLALGGAATGAPNSASAAVAHFAQAGFKIQWGRSRSTSDYEELFMLPEAFADMNFAVVTALNTSGHRAGLALSRPVNPRSFIVDRAGGDIDGQRDFYWIAVGR